LFTEQFINQLKYNIPSGINLLNTKLFYKFFYSILSYKGLYEACFGSFNFENINNISNRTSAFQEITVSKFGAKTKTSTETSFEEFFNADVSSDEISKIKKNFSGTEGKSMAILIYLLQSKLRYINIVSNSKTKSRKHFVKSLNGKAEKMQAINKYFESGSDELIIHKFTPDATYLDIEEKLNKLIS
jgi:hypothetical protein